jgi:hypothetical protein
MKHVSDTRAPRQRAQVYRGGCQCGAVAYEVELDPRAPTPGSVWESWVRPGSFRLLSGDGDLSGHAFAGSAAHHFFCERCGVRSFSRHRPAPWATVAYSVDVKCLSAVRAGG